MSNLSLLARLRHAVSMALSVADTITVGGVSAQCFTKYNFTPNSLAYNLSEQGLRVFELTIYENINEMFAILKSANSRNYATLKTDLIEVNVAVNRLIIQTDGTLYALVSELQ
jgi:hypothetical protein